MVEAVDREIDDLAAWLRLEVSASGLSVSR